MESPESLVAGSAPLVQAADRLVDGLEPSQLKSQMIVPDNGRTSNKAGMMANRLPQKCHADPALTALLIGMQGSATSTAGKAAARLLQWSFVDMDAEIEKHIGKEPTQLVNEQRRSRFRLIEVSTLANVIAENCKGCQPSLVACGAGIVETEAGLELLKKHWPVIFVDRHIDDIIESLDHGGDFSEEHPRDTYVQRLPKYLQYADFWLPLLRREEPEPCSRWLTKLLKIATSDGDVKNTAIYLGPETFFLSIETMDLLPAQTAAPANLSGRPVAQSISNLAASLSAQPHADAPPARNSQLLAEVACGADVLELRVDMLGSRTHSFIARQVAILRKYAHGASLLFTLRSKDQGGDFEGSDEEYLDLLRLGLRLGCDFIDVECTRGLDCIGAISRERRGTLLIGSYTDTTRVHQRSELEHIFKLCLLNGAAAVAKVIVKGRGREDNFEVQDIGRAIVPPDKAFIGVCTGVESKISRLFNQVLCPGTHPKLLNRTKDELHINEIVRCRRALGLMGASRQVLVLGPEGPEGAVALRLLPKMMESAFGQSDGPLICRAADSDTIEEAEHVLSSYSVAGALVVGKLRRELLPLVKASAAATRVGVVDVITKSAMTDELCGHSMEHVALKARVKAALGDRLPSRVGDQLGLVLLPDEAPWENELLAPTARASQLALSDLGFAVVYHGPNSAGAMIGPDTISVQLSKEPGQKLGIDVIDMQSLGCLQVVKVQDGLINEWNQCHPRIQVQPDDVIFEINGVSGNVQHLVEQCQKTEGLHMRVKRPDSEETPQGTCCALDDLSSLSSLPRLDVLIIVGKTGLPQALQETLQDALSRFQPTILVAMPWPAGVATTAGSGAMQNFENQVARNTVAQLLFEQSVACAEICLSSICSASFDEGSKQRNVLRRHVETIMLSEIGAELSGYEPTITTNQPGTLQPGVYGSSLPVLSVLIEDSPPKPP